MFQPNKNKHQTAESSHNASLTKLATIRGHTNS